ncbi:hypothetical protein ABZ654_12005 [Streptomyces hygroscopicus]|uniref:hypothetical protein n=1 Tax=Streptomyces hygroscopicus TaxID=1912 RepID=UPI0033E12028
MGRLRAAGLVGARELLGWWGPYELRLVAPYALLKLVGHPTHCWARGARELLGWRAPYKLRLVGPLRLLRWWGPYALLGSLGPASC